MKGEEWKNAWPDSWALGKELGIKDSMMGRWVHRHPIEEVFKALKAARNARNPTSYVIGVLSK